MPVLDNLILLNLFDGHSPVNRFQSNLGLEFRPKCLSLCAAHRPLPFRFGQQLNLLSQIRGPLYFDLHTEVRSFTLGDERLCLLELRMLQCGFEITEFVR